MSILPKNLFSRTSKSILGRWWWTIDRGFLGLLLLLIVIGVTLVVSASPPVAMRIGLGQYHFLIRHLIVLVPSIAIMIGISLLDIRQIWRISSIGLLGSIICMIYVLGFGMEIKGAQRWIHLPGFSLQPSEFAKPFFIVVASWLIARQKDTEKFHGMRYASILFAVVVGLLVLQPDIGMTFVLTCCFLVLVFLAGIPFRIIFLLAGGGIGALFAAYFSLPHFRSRLDRFLNPESGDTYQIEKSLDAFKNGGIFGTGPGQGTVKLSIPDSHADFIFSVAGEEFGLFFIVILIALYGYIIVRGFNRIMDSNNLFVVLAVGGLLTMFGLQALVHMGSALHLLPTKGMTLPLVSYGGSSLLSMCMAMGMVLALTRRQVRSGIAQQGLSIRPVGSETL